MAICMSIFIRICASELSSGTPALAHFNFECQESASVTNADPVCNCQQVQEIIFSRFTSALVIVKGMLLCVIQLYFNQQGEAIFLHLHT